MDGQKHDSETEGGRMRGGRGGAHDEPVGGVLGRDLRPQVET